MVADRGAATPRDSPLGLPSAQGWRPGLLVYSGIILSLGEVFAARGIDAWLGILVRDGLPAMADSRYGFVAVLAAVAFLLRFLVSWMTLDTVLALVTLPIAEGLGIHPFVPVLVTLVASVPAWQLAGLL